MKSAPIIRRVLLLWGGAPLLLGYPIHLLTVTMEAQLSPERFWVTLLALASFAVLPSTLLAKLSLTGHGERWLEKWRDKLIILIYLVILANLVLIAAALMLKASGTLAPTSPRISHAMWLFGTTPAVWAMVWGVSSWLFYTKPGNYRLESVKTLLLLGCLLAMLPLLHVPSIANAVGSDRPEIYQRPQVPVPRQGAPRHIILLTFDGWRFRSTDFGRVGFLTSTPHMASLSRESFVFEQSRTSSDFTHIALPSLLSGLYPPHLYRIPANGLYSIREGSIPSLPALLKSAGYQTSYFTTWVTPQLMGMGSDFQLGRARNVLLSPQQLNVNLNTHSFFPGFALGEWATQLLLDRLKRKENSQQGSLAQGQASLNEALAQYKNPAGRTFTWIHLPIPHTPYHNIPDEELGKTLDAPARFKVENEGNLQKDRDFKALERAYERFIRFADAELGRLLTHLKASDIWQDTLLIVTSDHGEAHSNYEHLYHGFGSPLPDIARVPLLIRVPGQKTGRVDSRPSSLVDVVPTVCDIVFGEIPSYLQGESLIRPPRSSERAVYTWCTSWSWVNPVNVIPTCTSIAAYNGSFELVTQHKPPGPDALYQHRNGVRGSKNLISEYPDIASELRAKLTRECPPAWGNEGSVQGL